MTHNTHPVSYDHYIRRARTERSEALAEMSRAAFRAARAIVTAPFRAYRRREAINTLQALDERTLKDIGVPRGDIAYVVNSLTKSAQDKCRPLGGDRAHQHAA